MSATSGNLACCLSALAILLLDSSALEAGKINIRVPIGGRAELKIRYSGTMGTVGLSAVDGGAGDTSTDTPTLVSASPWGALLVLMPLLWVSVILVSAIWQRGSNNQNQRSAVPARTPVRIPEGSRPSQR